MISVILVGVDLSFSRFINKNYRMRAAFLNVEVGGIESVVFDECPSGRNIFTH